MEENYIVYIKVDAQNRITEINSSAFITDTTGWIEVDRGLGDKYHHAQGNYLPQPVMTGQGVYRYKLVNGRVCARTADEIDADAAEPNMSQSNQLDQIEAQVAYTAMMTDTLLEVK